MAIVLLPRSLLALFPAVAAVLTPLSSTLVHSGFFHLALNLLILNKGTFFMCDTYVSPDPTVAEISEMTALAAEEIKRFGLTPKVALLMPNISCPTLSSTAPNTMTRS